MRKIMNKNILFGFVLGIILTSGISVIAINMYGADQISYNDSNVKSALDYLYDAAANSTGAVSTIAKDVNGNNATINYYGARVSSVTKQFSMPKGKYLLNIYSTFTQSYYGGDSTGSATVSGANITKLNNYGYIVDITADSATISITFTSGGYGDSGDSRTMYAITFYQ